MRFLVTWVLLALMWVGLSGHYDLIHLLFGLVSVTLVSALSWRHLAPEPDLGRGLGRLVRLARYTPWLLWQILLANWDVLLRVLGTRPVDPVIVRFTPGVHSDFGRVAIANSITLTPGTVSVAVEGDDILVHAVAPDAARGILEGEMGRRVQWVEGPPDAAS